MNKELMPREKIIKNGVESLQDFELLAVLLQTGTKSESILEFSKRVLSDLNGLNDMVNMSVQDWMMVKGIKESKASKLVAFLEFAKRVYQYEKEDILLTSEKAVFDFVKYDFSGKDHEELVVLFVNAKCSLISKKKLSVGKVNILYVDIKEIVNLSIRYKASGIFIVHNHPSGDVNPSKSDIDLTNALKKGLEYFDVQLLDHLVVTSNKYFSFNSNKLL